ncbi:MAG: heterodisulfide reductase subunit B, partial [Candidatus Baldrarchaeia archaeon]
ALTIAGLKLKAIKSLNVDGLVVSCPSCKIMLGAKQEAVGAIVGEKFEIPVLYYTQLLGLALEIEAEKLGLHLNQSPVDKIIEKLT